MRFNYGNGTTHQPAYRFAECRVCGCYYKYSCIPIASSHEDIPTQNATEVFELIYPVLENSSSFTLKMADFDCAEGGLLTIYNLKIICNEHEHSFPIRFGGKNPPHFCQKFNICVFISTLIALLREKGFESSISSDNEIRYSSLYFNGVTFKQVKE